MIRLFKSTWILSRNFSRIANVIDEVNLKKKDLLKPTFIDFKIYTGNELIFVLNECSKLKPSEISSALLEIGKRKGAPKGFD